MANSGKVNSKQIEAMVDFMEINYRKLFGKFGNFQGRKEKSQLWNELAIALNALGPRKEATKWKDVRCLFLFFRVLFYFAVSSESK